MKKLFLLYITVLLLFSCSNEEGGWLDSSNEQNTSIEFGELKTRAVIGSADEILSFGVYADKNTGDAGTNGATQFTDYLFTNEKVSRSTKDLPWGYDNLKYWVYNRTYHFFAYYPFADNNIVATPQRTTNAGKEVYQIGFTTPNNADTDFMTAMRTLDTTGSIPGSVEFSFSHVLSKINVSVAKHEDNVNNKVVVTSVSFKGVKKIGNYICERHIANKSESWAVDDNEITGTFSRNKLTSELSTTATTILDTELGEEFLFIPQTIDENGIILSIEYQFYNNDGSYAYKNTIEVPLPTTSVNKWEIAKSYIYKIVLDPESNSILFESPTVNGWNSVQQTGGTIIIQ